MIKVKPISDTMDVFTLKNTFCYILMQHNRQNTLEMRVSLWSAEIFWCSEVIINLRCFALKWLNQLRICIYNKVIYISLMYEQMFHN